MLSSELLKKVRLIEIETRRMVNELFSGEYHSAFKGRGMEFAEVREYQFGDDVRLIDWNVSARQRAPYIKVMEEERELTVFFLIDVSRSGKFGSIDRFKSEVAAEICAVLSFSAINNGDKVGLLSFSDRIERYIAPRKGKSEAMRIIRELLTTEYEAKATNLKAGMQFLSKVLHKKAIIFIISDFYEINFERELRVLNNKHDVVLVQMLDPLDRALPDIGLMMIHDAETGEQILTDTTDNRLRERYRGSFLQRQQELEQLSKINHIDLISINTDESYVLPLIKFFKQRGKLFR
ncbi:MAG TPA: DUF58 domain-containing protein [Candidatus Marinimicrobia bacterium]|nr:DUF58 domain-containing protein [Candidatus Neomarinimicrobiota bacterium]